MYFKAWDGVEPPRTASNVNARSTESISISRMDASMFQGACLANSPRYSVAAPDSRQAAWHGMAWHAWLPATALKTLREACTNTEHYLPTGPGCVSAEAGV